jgi:hypothetical protein
MPEGAVYVGRPSLWGNPWSFRRDFVDWPGVRPDQRREAAVTMYRRELEHWGLMSDWDIVVSDTTWEAERARQSASGAQNMAEYAPHALRGHDLVCWCPLDQLCHADVLLELANA